MIRNQSTLQRWALFSPNTRMPDDISELGMTEQELLKGADPELFALLANTATAVLEMSALNGTLAEQAISPQERQNAEIQAEIQRLSAVNPFGGQGSYDDAGVFTPGPKPNLTNQIRLRMIAPELAGSLKAAAAPPVANQGMSQEECDRVNSQLRYS